jgi:hypothetical protein
MATHDSGAAPKNMAGPGGCMSGSDATASLPGGGAAAGRTQADPTTEGPMAEELKTARMGEAQVKRGAGGETHQIAGDGTDTLTTQQGVPVADDQNSLKIGRHGPTLLEDFHLREKIFHFDHERIPERVVHARGFGAHGYFEATDSLSDLTTADIFQRPGCSRC